MDRVNGRVGDEELVELARTGDQHAFGVLWERHARAGLTVAGRFRSIADPDDIVAESYLRILRAVQRGGGPREAFRPYLYRTIRNVALSWKPVTNPASWDEVEDPADDRPGPEEVAIGTTTTVRAFRTLPERWQTVLWYTEVEGMEPAQAAPLLGLTANATAALAYRARDGLKNAWLQAHVSGLHVPAECRWTTARMAEYARGGLSPRARVRFAEHLKTCARCSILLEEIDQLSTRLAIFLLPLAIGGAAASALLAQRQSSSGQQASANSAGTARVTPMVASGPGRGVIALLAAGAAAVLVAGGAFAVLASFSTGGPDASAPHASTSPSARPAPSPPAPDPTTTADPTEVPAPAAPVAPPVARRPAQPAPPLAATPAPPPDTVPPNAPVVTSPDDGVLSSNALPRFTGTGEAGAVVQVVRLAADGVTVVEQTGSTVVGVDGSWAVTATSPVPDGDQHFGVTLTDAAGNVSPAVSRMLTIDTVALPPSVDPLPPSPLLWLPGVTGQAEPHATVELQDENGSVLGSATADASGAWSIPLPDPGRDDETVVAVQTDPAGNHSAPSAAVGPIVFDRPTLLEPSGGSTVPTTGGSTVVQVQIAGISGMQVEVFVDGVSTGNLHTLASTPIVRVTQALPDGSHNIGVRYVDPASGRVGSTATLAFSIG